MISFFRRHSKDEDVYDKLLEFLKFDLDGLQLVLLLIGFFTLLIVSVIEYNTKKN